jgi:hypothetical protein
MESALFLISRRRRDPMNAYPTTPTLVRSTWVDVAKVGEEFPSISRLQQSYFANRRIPETQTEETALAVVWSEWKASKQTWDWPRNTISSPNVNRIHQDCTKLSTVSSMAVGLSVI